jgi:hypothetical protein
MEYVIRLRDKRVHDAVMTFLRTLGFTSSEVHTETVFTGKQILQDAAAVSDDDAGTFGLAAFGAGFDEDEPDISDRVVREPNPRYGQ